jgi:hypothetical protein
VSRPFSKSQTALPEGSAALAEIVGGLTLLLTAMWHPAFPAATGMALVALGAMRLTVVRFQRSEAFVSLLLLNVAIYGALVALCVGARLDVLARQDAASPALVFADLAVSVWPIVAALTLVSRSISGQHSAS